MDIINIAIVGYGKIAKTHELAMSAANIKYNLPFKFNFSHIVTSRKDSVYSKDAVVCGNVEEALSDGNVDIVDICSVNNKHLKDIEDTVKFGKAIYCEKPLAGKIEEAKAAVELVEKHKIPTGVPLMFRHLPCVQMLKREVEAKSLGNIIEFKSLYYHKGYLSQEKRKGWRTGADAGGGALLDLGIHMMDTIRHVFGDAKNVSHEKKIYFENVDVDEICYSKIEMENGTKGTMECSRIFAQRKQQTEITVYCERGSIKCDFYNPYELEVNYFDGSRVYIRAKENDKFMKYFANESISLNFHMDAHIACLVDFASEIHNKSGTGVVADFRQAYLAQLMTQ